MYIKQIIIEGYKSYGQRFVIGPFDPGLNVVVGRNGSGKSNFFNAIELVISDDYAKLSLEQRQSLFHEGARPGTVSASVEIIFENSDRRIPIDKNEISLKRTVGLKSDQYLLNKKVITRNEVIGLLEAAGFSRSNPYYIVKQGKINQLAITSESRLKLLQEIAGTDVFEEKRNESINLMRQTEIKCKNIEGLLNTLDERMEILTEEMQELKKYQKLEKRHRCIEYIIHEREKTKNKEKLDEYEAEYNILNKIHSKLSKDFEELVKKVKEATKECKKRKKDVMNAEEEKNNLKLEQEEILKEETKLKLAINDLEKEVESEIANKNKIEKELQNLDVQIEEKKTLLNEVKLKYEDKLHEEEDIIKSLDLKEQQRKELYSKQGRSVQFHTREERDSWINNELEQLKRQIEEKKIYISNLESDICKDDNKCKNLVTEIENCKIEIQRQTESIVELHKKSGSLHKDRDEKSYQRKDMHKEDKKNQDDLDMLKDELAEVNQKLNSIFGKSIFNGINSVNRVLDTFRKNPQILSVVDDYYGLVIENFNCEPVLHKAIEVTAAGRLFYHIVRTNSSANKILAEINRQQLPGTVTFMPLDRLNLPKAIIVETKDARPMISKLQFHDDIEKAIRNIFGRTLVCRDLKAATEHAQEYKLDCVTLDGDQAGSSGWLKGGYINRAKSPMELQKKRTELLDTIDKMNNCLDITKQKIHEINQAIDSYTSEIQKVEIKVSYAKDIIQKEQNNLNLKKEELNSIIELKRAKEKSLVDHKLNLETINATKESLENELTQELTVTLTVADQQKINELNDSIAQLSKQLKKVYKERGELETEKFKLENLLTKNLICIREKKLQDLQEIFMEDRKQILEEHKSKLEILQSKIEKIKIDLEAQNEKVIAAIDQQNAKLKDIDELKEEEKVKSKLVEKSAQDLGKITNKMNIVKQNLIDITQKSIEHSIIPNSELYTKFSEKPTKELFTALGKVKKSLKEFENVNKKAIDQFDVFIEQRQKLQQRKEELDRAVDKIQLLFDTLEQRKSEQIEFTFKQVSKYFHEIFHKLVPMGQAQLVMLSNQESSERSSRDSSSINSSATMDNFIGIDVKVSFTQQENSTREIHQLSGGQKSLVALTLIFAIQKCDPAPFYLFDEIDHALDSEHRKAVSEMINELSVNAQFIIVTHSMELLGYAKQLYGVSFKNNKSSLNTITLEEAEDFLQDV